jgi:hypothetical protein
MFKEKSALYMIGPLTIRASSIEGCGLGVFATADIKKSQYVERSPVLMFHHQTLDHLAEQAQGSHIMSDYCFRWMPGRIWSGQMVMCWGYGCMYNHSDNPNVMFNYREGDHPGMEFFSTRDISAGEELFIRYLPGDSPLWFDTPERSIKAYQDEWYGEGWDSEPD